MTRVHTDMSRLSAFLDFKLKAAIERTKPVSLDWVSVRQVITALNNAEKSLRAVQSLIYQEPPDLALAGEVLHCALAPLSETQR